MNKRNKRIDIIRLIDKKNNFINKNAGIISNLFSKELYSSYVLSYKKKNTIPDYDKIIKNIKKSKSIEKYIIKDVTKNIPINLLQYFSEYEFKRFANQLVKSFYKNNDKLKVIKMYDILKNNSTSRTKSLSPKVTDNSNYSNTINNENELNTIKYDGERNLLKSRISHHINNKIKNRYIIENISRKHSANICSHLTIKGIKNDEINENIDDEYEKKYKNLTLSTKKFKNRNRNLILKSTNKYASEDDKNSKMNSINKDIENLYFNTENNNFRTIYDYNYTRKPEINNKLLLKLNNDEKPEKKIYSSMKTNYIKKNKRIRLPKAKNLKTELILNSFSPKELLITKKTSNILCNLKEIKKEIKDTIKSNSTSKSLNSNILYFTGYNKKEKFKDLKYFNNELKKSKRYQFYLKNEKLIEKKKNNTFNGLRYSFNTSEKTRANLNERNFIKTLNHLCVKEKQFEKKIDNIYKQNYWLRIDKNKKIEKNNKNRIDKMNKKTIIFNSILSKMNQLSKNNHIKYSLTS
jgi:hypothetical protein